MTQHKLDDVRRWCGIGACNGQYKTNMFLLDWIKQRILFYQKHVLSLCAENEGTF